MKKRCTQWKGQAERRLVMRPERLTAVFVTDPLEVRRRLEHENRQRKQLYEAPHRLNLDRTTGQRGQQGSR